MGETKNEENSGNRNTEGFQSAEEGRYDINTQARGR